MWKVDLEFKRFHDAWGNFRRPDKPGHGVAPCREDELDDYLDRFEGGRAFQNTGFDPWHLGRHHSRAFVPYLYVGRRLDAFSQIYNNRNRQYSPKYGRFISKDPIGFDGGNNLWGYVTNNPTKWSDPFGLYPYVLVVDDSVPDFLAISNTVIMQGGSDWFPMTPVRYNFSSYPTTRALFEQMYDDAQPTTGGEIYRMIFIAHSSISSDLRTISNSFHSNQPCSFEMFNKNAWVFFLVCRLGGTGVPQSFANRFLKDGGTVFANDQYVFPEKFRLWRAVGGQVEPTPLGNRVAEQIGGKWSSFSASK
ncbi:MAG: RHS repeat-associated core domain-containing protein [Candidatus Ozemobacteraceae bacterium]